MTLIEWNRRANVFLITLGSYELELFDVIIAINFSLAQLD